MKWLSGRSQETLAQFGTTASALALIGGAAWYFQTLGWFLIIPGIGVLLNYGRWWREERGLYLFGWGTLADAEKALEGPWPASGVKILRRLAQRRNAAAQVQLGFIYEYGHKNSFTRDSEKGKIEPDLKQAAYWFKRAADKGHREGQDYLWQVYLHEGNVDEEKASTYLLVAAKAGVVNAQRFLGICYMDGSVLISIPRNHSEGLKWLRRAAKAGCDSSQQELAKAYRDGTGVDVDLVKAFVWFSMAAREELAREQGSLDRHRKWNADNPEWALPDDFPKRDADAKLELNKIAEQFSKSELVEALALAEKCFVNRGEGFE